MYKYNSVFVGIPTKSAPYHIATSKCHLLHPVSKTVLYIIAVNVLVDDESLHY